MNNRYITINILPQSAKAWFCIFLAVAVFSISSCMSHIPDSNSVELAKIKAQYDLDIAKVNAAKK